MERLHGPGLWRRVKVMEQAVFNTSMTGYQEILTDPSYHGQIVAMTYPQIGNYGVNDEDAESRRPWVRGFVVRELSGRVSNFRADGSLECYLDRHGIIGIEGIDTRALVRLTRDRGAMKGILTTVDLDDDSLVAKAKASPGLIGRDLTRDVMPESAIPWDLGLDALFGSSMTDRGSLGVRSPLGWGESRETAKRPHVVALDFGMKWNIPRHLVDLGCIVTVVPGSVTAEAILDHKPDGIFISNGPGDPGALTEATSPCATLIRTASGLTGYPRSSGSAWDTSSSARRSGGERSSSSSATAARITPSGTTNRQGRDHDAEPRLRRRSATLPPEVEPSHINLNDQTLEGIRHKRLPIFSVQYHPRGIRRPARQRLSLRRVSQHDTLKNGGNCLFCC